MDKVESIARRILGWKLNSADKWFDSENGIFIDHSEFQPEQNIEHAMKIVERLEKFGFSYTVKDDNEVCFNEFCATGGTLAEAITNAAHSIADNSSPADAWI